MKEFDIRGNIRMQTVLCVRVQCKIHNSLKKIRFIAILGCTMIRGMVAAPGCDALLVYKYTWGEYDTRGCSHHTSNG